MAFAFWFHRDFQVALSGTKVLYLKIKLSMMPRAMRNLSRLYWALASVFDILYIIPIR